MEWHPIETAPDDGTPVVLYCPEGVDRDYAFDGPALAGKVCIGWRGHPSAWYPSPRGPVWVAADMQADLVTYGEMTGSSIEYEQVTVAPTHWMPLPEMPRTDTAQKQPKRAETSVNES